MHIEFVDESSLNIYLSKDRMKNINFDVLDEIEYYFKNLFIDLKKIYNISITGYYDINVYKDKYYGIVINLKKDDIDYIDYFENQVEMNIQIINKEFVYKVDDIFFIKNDIKDKIKIYMYHNNIYIKLTDDISYINIAELLEFSTLVYDDETNDIIKKGLILEI